MSYNTTYRITIEPPSEELLAILDSIDDGYSPFGESTTWYRWEEDMRKFSALYPDYLFHLHGEGDQKDDIWNATFKAGKAHIREATITIDPYDEGKLE